MKGFHRHWFLILLLVGVSTGLLRPGWIHPWTEPVNPKAVIALALYLMAWTLPSRHLVGEMVRPGPALWALVISYGLCPVAAWCLQFALSLPDFRVGLFIAASVPCTLASAVIWTRRAGGSDATVLVVILLSTLTGWLVTPTWLAWTTASRVDLDTSKMMGDLVLTLVLPVCLGQLSRASKLLELVANRWVQPLSLLAQLLVLLIICKASAELGTRLAGEKMPPLSEVVPAILVALTLHLGTLAAGFWSGRWLGFSRPQYIAIAFAGSQKTLPVTLFLFKEYYQTDFPFALLPILVYHVGQLLLDTPIAARLASANHVQKAE